ncbi:MAG: ABC transporter ATP-binding protein [Thermoprotei archaeon]
MTRILEVKDLKVHFNVGGLSLFNKPPPLKAVDGVSFYINSGETLGLAGETGSGKSTIAKILVGLYKPTSGRIRFLDQEIDFNNRAHITFLRRNIGIVFQDPVSSLNPRLKVRDIIREALVAAGVDRREHDERIAKIVPLVGLRPSSLDSYPRQLSGGEKQRVSLARALVVPKKLLILDEPTSSLDVSVQAQVLNTLRSLKAELGLSYLFITHDLNVLKYMSNRVCVLFYGKLVESGPTKSVITHPIHPYTQELVANLLHRSAAQEVVIGEHQPSFDGCVYRRICPFAMGECSAAHPPLYEVGEEHAVACYLSKKGILAR